MKSVFVFISVGIFFLLISAFLISNFSPFDLNKIQEIVEISKIDANSPELLNDEIASLIQQGFILDYLSNNAYIVFFSTLSAIFSFLAAIHLFVDKVFFKSIWQIPSIFDATRRSLLISLVIGLSIYLKLLKVDSTTLLLLPITAIVVEILFMSSKKDILRVINKIIKQETSTLSKGS